MLNSSVSAAVAVLYRGTGGTPVKVTLSPDLLGLGGGDGGGRYRVSEVFEGVEPLVRLRGGREESFVGKRIPVFFCSLSFCKQSLFQ